MADVDVIDRIVARLNSIDPAQPPFDPAAVEQAVGRHAALIGFENPAFSWVMGPQEAAHRLGAVDFAWPAARRWSLTMQALQDRATGELQRDSTAWRRFRRAQDEAEQKIAATLYLKPFDAIQQAWIDVIEGDVFQKSHGLPHLVSALLRDMMASAAVESEALRRLNDAYLPFVDSMTAGLGCFWTLDERFICMPLPRLAIRDGDFVRDGGPAVMWRNGEAYAIGDEGLVLISDQATP